MKCERAIQLFALKKKKKISRQQARAGSREAAPGRGAGSCTPGHVRRSGQRCDRCKPSDRTGKRGRRRRTPEGEEEEEEEVGNLQSKAGNTLQQSNRINYANQPRLRDAFPLPRRALLWTLEDKRGAAPARSKYCFVPFFLFCISLGITGSRLFFPGEFCLTCGNNANELKRRLPPPPPPRLSQSGPQKYETFEVKSSRDKPLHPAVLPPATVIPPHTRLPPPWICEEKFLRMKRRKFP